MSENIPELFQPEPARTLWSPVKTKMIQDQIIPNGLENDAMQKGTSFIMKASVAERKLLNGELKVEDLQALKKIVLEMTYAEAVFSHILKRCVNNRVLLLPLKGGQRFTSDSNISAMIDIQAYYRGIILTEIASKTKHAETLRKKEKEKQQQQEAA